MEYLSKYLQIFFTSSQTSRIKIILTIFEIMWREIQTGLPIEREYISRKNS